MPEGPEIRIAADQLERVLLNQPLEKVVLQLPQLTKYEKQLVGQRVSAIQTRGKALLTYFSNGLVMYSHNQLYGRWQVFNSHKLPESSRSLRVGLFTPRNAVILYSASDIDIGTETEIEQTPFLQRVGPDVFNESVSKHSIAERLKDKRFKNRALSSLLLDQQFVAGLGNYLRSEILFFAGIHFNRKPSQLTPAQINLLAENIHKICWRSYKTHGVTVPRNLAARLKRDGQSYEGHRFMVFGREALPCRICSTEIVKEVAGSRRIYFCPSCQSG